MVYIPIINCSKDAEIKTPNYNIQTFEEILKLSLESAELQPFTRKYQATMIRQYIFCIVMNFGKTHYPKLSLRASQLCL